MRELEKCCSEETKFQLGEISSRDLLCIMVTVVNNVIDAWKLLGE